jgi:hypothetical protein
MFRPAWPSSSVYDISLFIPEEICFAAFVAYVACCYSMQFLICGWVRCDVLLFIIIMHFIILPVWPMYFSGQSRHFSKKVRTFYTRYKEHILAIKTIIATQDTQTTY